MKGRWQQIGYCQHFKISTKMSYWIGICLIALFGLVHAEDHTDLIKEFGFPELPPGITAVPGMCGMERNLYQLHKSPAYNIDKDAILTVQTSEIFPDGFPIDFSIVLAVRSNRTSQKSAPIFTIYSDESEEVLSLKIGPQIEFSYEQIDASFNQHNDINFGIGITDDKWHRIGLSVKGSSATLNLDCTQQVTRRLDRTLGSSIDTNGLILTGVQMSNDDGFFMGDVQMMSIWNTPEAGYEVCTKYVTPCIDQSFYGEDSSKSSRSYAYTRSGNARNASVPFRSSKTFSSSSSSGSGSLLSRSSSSSRVMNTEYGEAGEISDDNYIANVKQNHSLDSSTVDISNHEEFSLRAGASNGKPLQQRTDFGLSGGASNGFGTTYHLNETKEEVEDIDNDYDIDGDYEDLPNSTDITL